MKKLLFFSVLGGLLSGTILAQSPRLYTHRGPVDLTESRVDPVRLSSTLYEGNYHVLIQFYEVPSYEAQMQLRRQGIYLYDYLPDNTFISTIPLAFDVSVLNATGVRSIAAIQQTWKIHPVLDSEFRPDWLQASDERLHVQVTVFPGFFAKHTGVIPAELLASGSNWTFTPYPHTYAADLSMPEISALASQPFIQFIAPIDAPGEPENYRGRTDHRSNVISVEYASGLKYNGAGVNIMMSDDGSIGPHVDYHNRIDQSQSGNSTGNHGDHVAGIIMGAGNKDPRQRGQSWGADLRVYTYPSGLYDFPSAYVNHGVVITSTSYSNGCNSGYTAFAQLMDQTTRDHYSLIHVFSAGNDGGSNCGYGAGSGWGNITGGHKVAKNCIAVGNVTNVDVIATSSSRGPAHDGRIKPEVVAVGSSVNSTVAGHSYQAMSGTSMACPGVSGILGQLYHVYKDISGGQNPPSALIKAVVMNTADDLGNAGPDYIYGFGRVNVRRAYRTLVNQQHIRDSINQGGFRSHTIQVPANTGQLRVMIYWHDPAASVNAPAALVNNLNMTVTDPSSTSWNPWILNPAPNAMTLNTPAVRGTDNLNNMEQVTLDNPAAGNYTVNISGASIPSGPYQEYFVVYEFVPNEVVLTYPLGGEGFTQGESIRVRWDYYGSAGTFALAYSTNSGSTWTNISTSIPAASRYYDWTAPGIINGNVMLRITRGSYTSVSDTSFSIINLPVNIHFDTVCGSQVTLDWDDLPGATAYEVFKLGNKYMESQGTTTASNFTMNNVNLQNDNWFSVRAYGANNARGRRAEAIQLTVTSLNCTLNRELEISAITEPFADIVPSCFADTVQHITARIRNNGLQAASGFTLQAFVNGSLLGTENFVGSVAPQSDVLYQFSNTFDASQPGNYSVVVVVNYTGDQNIFNDTLTFDFVVQNQPALVPPVTEDFESFSLCATTSNCETGVCNLANGWRNIPNGINDDIDWRTHEGAPPSSGTGPSQDFNPGTPTGNYLYLESSNCFNKEAQLVSPCIDLTNSAGVSLIFAYHMYGASMGSLHVDVFANGQWNNDVITPLNGNQGNTWHTATVNLNAYSGQYILVRFRGITGNSFTSDMAIDDIRINGLNANFNATSGGSAYCAGTPVTFTDNSTGNVSSYQWNFGPGANPPTASTQGPHSVIYQTAGTKNVQLTIDNGMGSDVHTLNITIDSLPTAAFGTSMFGNQVNFTNNSVNASGFSWNFGDGNTSGIQYPVHTYSTAGNYTVTLIVTNACGSDTVSQVITVGNVGLEDVAAGNIKVYPNPSTDHVIVELDAPQLQKLEMWDVTGRKIGDMLFENAVQQVSVNMTTWPAGVYTLRLYIGEQVISRPVIKQ